MKSSNIGGQAVIEGVMMRNREKVAVAVRTPDGEIVTKTRKYGSAMSRHKVLGWPIIRGVTAFVESLVTGISTLNYSASFFEEEEEAPKNGKKKEKKKDEDGNSGSDAAMMVGTILVSLLIAVALFLFAPYYLSTLLLKLFHSDSSVLLAVFEGVIKLLIFIGYLAAISCMKDIKRTFMYHGAEHKCINCIESGKFLTVENVLASSKEHRRCGTSFIFFVLFLSIILYIFIVVPQTWLKILIRILLIPVIAGLSYEFIKWAGNSDSKLAYILSRPGMLMQAMTTREPDASMVEVGISSVEAVFDWRKWLVENGYKTQEEITAYDEALKAEENE